MTLNRQKRHMVGHIAFSFALTLSILPETAGAECGRDFDHSHGAWNTLVKQHVSRGAVSYSGLHSGQGGLKTYLSGLEGVCRNQYDGWSAHQKLAFWINAYNAYTVLTILDSYPTTSIMKIGGGQGAAFKRRFIPLGHLWGSAGSRTKGAKISLNDVENNIIRKQFREPRIHFALNCAAKSCPPLRAEAYTASALSRQLEAQTRAFIRDSSVNRYDAKTHTLFISRIFEWYAEDFQRGSSTVPTTIGRYLGGEAADAIKGRAPQVKYLEYNWALNGR